MKIDLHVHSTASDGKLSPKELIDLAIRENIPAIAIADHDTLDGLEEAEKYSKSKNFEFIKGIEFSANPGDLAKEIHIVGLFVDYKNEQIINLVEKQKQFRKKARGKIIVKLNELGYEITSKEVAEYAKRESFGRPAIAEVLMKRYPIFKDKKQVFNELLGKDGKAFCKDESSTMEEIIKTIYAAGGIAILAHPAYLFENAELVISEFIRLGGKGIEVDCAYDSFGEEAKTLRDKFGEIARKNNLLISGGTDFHEGKDIIGNHGATKEELGRLKEMIPISRR